MSGLIQYSIPLVFSLPVAVFISYTDNLFLSFSYVSTFWAQYRGKLQSLGRRKRKLRGQHDAETELNRSYARCSVCGTEYFPPR